MLSTISLATSCLMACLVLEAHGGPVPMYESRPAPALDAVHHAEVGPPPWHSPCGQSTGGKRHRNASFKISWYEQLNISLRKIRRQLKITIKQYSSQDYESLYREVRVGIRDHQFGPNWVPGKGDVNILTSQPIRQKTDLAKNLPKLHEDFQKFGVGLEAILATEVKDRARVALSKTQAQSRQFLCEVETALSALEIAVPPRVQRDIMAPAERMPDDDLRRRLRDWGILFKYRDYLKGWQKMFSSKMAKSHEDQSS